ncbi:6-hydroxy-3-succinoylpyridine 3-monooxygenase HspA [subsurface metagenome]
MCTNIYIDGFNLYYGSLRKTSFKWLDLSKLCEILLPNCKINRIRYFTAKVRALQHDPQAPVRQATYLRALGTTPIVSIHKSNFTQRPRVYPQFPLAYVPDIKPYKRPPLNVQILRAEEKESDVNLATYLLLDCFNNDFLDAVVITNDGDLRLPIEMVRNIFGKWVGIINPHKKDKLNRKLASVAPVLIQEINKSALAAAQFLPTLSDPHGTITKPPQW